MRKPDTNDELCSGGESPDGGRRRVCRTESVKTQVTDHYDNYEDGNHDDVEFQNSLLLLEEKMELLADLQQKAEKCRLRSSPGKQ